MCIFQGELASKVVTMGAPGVEKRVASDMQCRACLMGDDPDWISPLQQSLLDHDCISKNDTCRSG